MTWSRRSVNPEQRREQTIERRQAPAVPSVLTPRHDVTMAAGGTSGQPIIKDTPARPGKRAQTNKEREWVKFILEFGCVACYFDHCLGRPCAVHHIIVAGRRLGHLYTLPLCDPGHHQNGHQFGILSRHPFKAQFEAMYGKEMDLLEFLVRRYSERKKS